MGVTFRVQQAKAKLIPPTRARYAELTFDLVLRAEEGRPDGRPDYRGPCAQGPARERFVYVNSGT